MIETGLLDRIVTPCRFHVLLVVDLMSLGSRSEKRVSVGGGGVGGTLAHPG